MIKLSCTSMSNSASNDRRRWRGCIVGGDVLITVDIGKIPRQPESTLESVNAVIARCHHGKHLTIAILRIVG